MALDDIKIVELIKSKLHYERLRDLVIQTSTVSWGERISNEKLDKWLNNFTGKVMDEDAERSAALWLLLNFTYYTIDEVRELCRTIYNDFIHCKLIEYRETETIDENNISEKLDHIKRNTLFTPLGNPSESGTSILYYFRQAAELPIDVFEMQRQEYENVVIIDDVTLSGGQSTNYIYKYFEYSKIQAEHIYFLTFFATQKSLGHLVELEKILKKKIHPIYAVLLDERSKCFSETSDIFSNTVLREMEPLLEKFCTVYGMIAIEGNRHMKGMPLGFKNGQYMFGFFYNIPNNTLPIFWSTLNNWYPIFQRYDKIYTLEEGGRDYERQYI